VRTREKRRRAIEFLDRLERTPCRVERIRLTDEKRAIALVRAHKDKMYSLFLNIGEDKAKMVAPASQSLPVTSKGSWCALHLGNIGLITERDMTKVIAL